MRSSRGIRVIGVLALLALGAAGCRTAPEGDVGARAPGTTSPALENAVRTNLTQARDIDASRITVDAIDGVAVLSGTVPAEEQRNRAEEIARRTSGITEVRNRILVATVAGGATGTAPATSPETTQPPAGETGRTTTTPGGQTTPSVGQPTEERVRDQMRDVRSMEGADVRVRVEGGTVVLTGTVPSRQAKQQAEQAARQVPGVTRVQNQLQVR